MKRIAKRTVKCIADYYSSTNGSLEFLGAFRALFRADAKGRPERPAETGTGQPAQADRRAGKRGSRNTLAEVIATGLGSGFAPIAPATVGSAAALMIYWVLASGGTGDSPWFFALIGATLVVGWWAADRIITPGDEDPKRCVIDEFVGVWATCLFLPVTWGWLLAAFLMFRVLDIAKPLGIRRLEKLPGGFGIMADDLAAGLVGALVLNAVRLLFF